MKKTCKCCGDKYTANPEEDFNTQICDECFDIQESSNGMADDCFSDADPGL